MKIYFANNRYLNADNFSEDYRCGYKYLRFTLNQATLSLDTLVHFLTSEEVLSKITIVNDENQAIASFNDAYKSVAFCRRQFNDNGTAMIQVVLSSSEDGSEIGLAIRTND